jgi:hypothetical protein
MMQAGVCELHFLTECNIFVLSERKMRQERGLTHIRSCGRPYNLQQWPGRGGGPSSSRPPSPDAFVGKVNPYQRQVCLRAGTLGELRQQANVVLSLVARQLSAYVDRMNLWHALTHMGAHRPHIAPTCPAWTAHHPLPLASGPLQVAPITLHCGYWLSAPQLPAKSPHCTVRR